MASPVSGVSIGRTQIPQPMRVRGFTTILCDGTFRDPLPSDLQVSGRSPRSARGRSGPATSWREPRLILTASSQAGGRQQPAACVCKESESEPVTAAAAAAVLCQHSLQSGVSWRRPSGSFACHGPTIPLATHPVHLTGIHSDFSRCIFHHHGKLVVFMSYLLISLI